MQRLEVSGAVRPLYWSLGVKGLTPLISELDVRWMWVVSVALRRLLPR